MSAANDFDDIDIISTLINEENFDTFSMDVNFDTDELYERIDTD
jgi:hypothetical protein